MTVLTDIEVHLCHLAQPNLLPHVYEKRNVDSVECGDRETFEEVSLGCDLSRQRLAKGEQLREEGAYERPGRQLGHAAATGVLSAQLGSKGATIRSLREASTAKGYCPD